MINPQLLLRDSEGGEVWQVSRPDTGDDCRVFVKDGVMKCYTHRFYSRCYAIARLERHLSHREQPTPPKAA